MEEGRKKSIIYNSIALAIVLILSIAVFSLKGHIGYSAPYVSFYLPALLIVAGIIFVFGILANLIKGMAEVEDETGFTDFANTNDPEDYRLLGTPDTPFWMRVLPHIVLAIFIGIMVVNVPAVAEGFYYLPEVLSSGSYVSQVSESFFMSVPVGIAEDFIYLFLFPGIILALCIGIMRLSGVEITPFKYLVLVLIVCLITSAGYGAIVPGFASTHEVSFKDDMPKYIYVFSIGYAQSVLNMLTGLFLPIAHITNNWLVNENYQGNIVGSMATP